MLQPAMRQQEKSLTHSLTLTKKAPTSKTGKCLKLNGAETRNRTRDTRIFSPLLYRLSYLGTSYGEGYLHEKSPHVNIFSLTQYYSLGGAMSPRSSSKSRSSSRSSIKSFLGEEGLA